MKQVITYKTFKDTDLERHVSQKLKTIKQESLGDIAIASARELDPVEITGEIDAKVNVLVRHIMKTLQPFNEKLEASLQQLRIEAQREEIARKRQALENEMQGLHVDLQRIHLSYPWRWYFIPVLFIAAAVIGDALSNYVSLTLLAANLLTAILLVILLAAALGVGAHIAGSKAREAATAIAKWSWVVGGVTVAFGVFLFLGYLRTTFMELDGGASLSPWFFTLWNTGFFAVAMLVSKYLMPTKAQREERQQYMEKKRKLQKLENADKALKDHIDTEEAKYITLVKNQKALETYQQDLIAEVDAERHSIHATCKKEFALRSARPQPVVTISIPTHSTQHQNNHIP